MADEDEEEVQKKAKAKATNIAARKKFGAAVVNIFKSKDDEATQKRKAHERAVLARQAKLEAAEINQTWKFTFGDTVPKYNKDIFRIENVTMRNVWMEPFFLYNAIKKFKPDEFFHPPEYYALKWQPPGSNYRLLIKLDSPILQENAILMIARMNKLQRMRVFFHFAPVNPTAPVYAPRVHPSSLVSYKTKNAILRKLSDVFLEGRISIHDVQQIFSSGDNVWKSALFNVLPPDEQVYHEYLTEVPPVVISSKAYSKAYLDDAINLQEFADFKFPARKKLREVMAREYPQPYGEGQCVICGNERTGIIKCQNCDNKVCTSCINSVFRNEEHPMSFLLMHNQYCLKLGHLKEVAAVVVPEPGYLRQLRSTSRLASLQLLTPKREDAVIRTEMYEEETEEEKLQNEQDRLQKAADRAARIAKENPPELKEIVAQFMPVQKRFRRVKKDIMDYCDKIGDPGHTDQFIARNTRLRNKCMLKVVKKIKGPLYEMFGAANELNLIGPYIKDFLANIQPMIDDIANWEVLFPYRPTDEDGNLLENEEDEETIANDDASVVGPLPPNSFTERNNSTQPRSRSGTASFDAVEPHSGSNRSNRSRTSSAETNTNNVPGVPTPPRSASASFDSPMQSSILSSIKVRTRTVSDTAVAAAPDPNAGPVSGVDGMITAPSFSATDLPFDSDNHRAAPNATSADGAASST